MLYFRMMLAKGRVSRQVDGRGELLAQACFNCDHAEAKYLNICHTEPTDYSLRICRCLWVNAGLSLLIHQINTPLKRDFRIIGCILSRSKHFWHTWFVISMVEFPRWSTWWTPQILFSLTYNIETHRWLELWRNYMVNSRKFMNKASDVHTLTSNWSILMDLCVRYPYAFEVASSSKYHILRFFPLHKMILLETCSSINFRSLRSKL
jgi:hypothetical protein